MNYKKIISYLLIFVMFISMTANATTLAVTITVNVPKSDYTYTTNADGTIMITGYEGTGGDIVIPYQIEGKKVTTIGDEAFSCNTVISNVYVPNGVTSIGNFAFNQCRNLTSITIPSSVYIIGNNVFESCNSLTGIYVDENNLNYKSVYGVLFNKYETILMKYPSAKEETTYKIPNGVIKIDTEAFIRSTRLTSITIPSSVKAIGRDAIYLCSSLMEINVNENNANYRSVDGILFNKDKTILMKYPSAKAETTYEVPNGVTAIQGNAFENCSSLVGVVISNGVKEIGCYAFTSCTELKNIMIPSSVISIDINWIENCSKLAEINVDENNAIYKSVNGILFNKDQTTLIQYPVGKTETTYEIPNGVTTIIYPAFFRCSTLKNIKIPNSVNKIGNDAFCTCKGLTSISIPDKVTEIGFGAFSDCKSLKTATFEGNAPSMGAGVFDNCAPDFTINYYADSTGFTTPKWNGYNITATIIWTPLHSKICIEKPTQGEYLIDKTTVSGWALDGVGVSKVEILVNGNIAGTATYGDARTDIYAQYPNYGNPNAGYHFDLDTSKIADGSCSITVKVTNKNGTVTTTTVECTVAHCVKDPDITPKPTPSDRPIVGYDPFEIDLNCQPTDTAMDLTKDVMYITDKNAKKLYAVNCTTKEITSVSFNLPPESVYFKNDKVYVALLKQEHNPYMYEKDEQGAIAIVDAENMKIEGQIDVNIDPYDIEVLDDNYIIISSGSSQWTNIKCYSLKTKQEESSSAIRQKSYIEYNPLLNRIYTIDTDVSPRDYTAYNVNSGKFTDATYPGGYDSPYHGEYPLSTLFRISPDGKYLINSYGTVFSCAYDKGNDMKYYRTLENSFSDVAFNGTQKFYTVAVSGSINEYNYSNFQCTNKYFVGGDPIKLYYGSNQLIVLASVPIQGTKEYGIQIVDVCTNNSTSITYGDVNGDGRIDSTDYQLIKEYLLGSKNVFFDSNSLKAADVNGDGKINTTDCALVKRYINGMINKFPAEVMITPIQNK